MKKVVLLSLICSIVVALFFATVPQAEAYSLPDNGGVSFGCLWRDASCAASSVRETPPGTAEMPRFYLDVIEACTNAGYNGGVCALQASKAVAAASTYTICVTESLGDAANCAIAANFSANQITTARPAPVDPTTQTPAPAEPRLACDAISNISDRRNCNSSIAACIDDVECRNRVVGTFIVRQTVRADCLAAGNTANVCDTRAQNAGLEYMQNQTRPPVTTQPVTPTAPNRTGNLGYVPLEPIPGFNLDALLKGESVFGDILNILLQVVISLGALIAVGALVYGGIAYMLSGVSETRSEAKHRIEAAFWGLLILLASWLILNTINPQLLQITNIFRATPTTQNTGGATGSLQAPVQQTAAQLQTQINECVAKSTPTRNCVMQPGQNGGQSFCSC